MGWIWQRNADFNSAWKLSSNKDWPPTEYSRWQKYSTPVAFFVYNFKMYFKKGTPKQHKIAFFRDAWSHNSVPTQIFSRQVTYHHNNVGYSIFRQSRANLCTSINIHQTGEVYPFTRHLIRDETKEREGESGSTFTGQSQEDTVPNTTQLTVLRPGWVWPLCHPGKD